MSALFHLVQCVPQGVDGALKYAGVGEIKRIAFGFKQFARGHGLGHACGGQVHVGPAGEAVFEIPGRFAVANENYFVHVWDWMRGWWGLAQQQNTQHSKMAG
jgi:hypothetical protein